VDQFQDDLKAQGVDINALKADLAALTDRVAALEKEQKRVVITADALIHPIGTFTNSVTPWYDYYPEGRLGDRYGYGEAFDRDNRPLGSSSNPLERTFIYNDLQLGIKGRVSDSSSLNAIFSVGNYLNYALGMNSHNYYGSALGSNGGWDSSNARLYDFTLWNLYFESTCKLGPLGETHWMVGRIPFQLTPLTLKLVPPDSYACLPVLTSGNYVFDGGTAEFKLGDKVGLTAFAMKTNAIGNVRMRDTLVGLPMVSQMAGARAVIDVAKSAKFGLTYAQAGLGDNDGQGQIYGADLSAKMSGLGVAAEFAQSRGSNLATDYTDFWNHQNNAWNAKLTYQAGNLGVGAGYGVVQSNFVSGGYWDRIGRAVNLENVKGPMANLTYAITNKITFSADAHYYQPNDSDDDVHARTAIDQDPWAVDAYWYDNNDNYQTVKRIVAWNTNLKVNVAKRTNLDLGWEEAQWRPAGEGGINTRERYLNIGVGHTFNPNASLKVLY